MLAHRQYRRLWTAQTLSRWGDIFATVALAVLVFRISGSGIGVAGVVVAEIVPVLLLAPVAGVVVDRLPRRRVMVAADLWRAALAGLLPFVDESVVPVYAIAFGLSAGAVFFNPASSSLLPELVDEDELVAANSGLWSAAVVSQIALAPAAGGLVAAWGTGLAFGVNAASFIVSALVLRGLPEGRLREQPGCRAWWRQAAEGLHLLVSDRLLRVLALAQLLAALSAGATSALLVVLAAEHLGVGPGGFGLLLGAIGVGAALGPLALARLGPDPRRPQLVFGSYLLRGVVDLVLATVRVPAVAVGSLAVYGIGTSTGMVTFSSLLQAEVPEVQRGRVFSGFDMLWQFGRLASIALGGALADAFGIRAVYYLGGVLLIVAGLLGLAVLPSRRQGR
ncbi:MAG: MFS transporter [Actinomycetota bacterium]|nr:MFS transporter [Actinomycetota bacterium]